MKIECLMRIEQRSMLLFTLCQNASRVLRVQGSGNMKQNITINYETKHHNQTSQSPYIVILIAIKLIING